MTDYLGLIFSRHYMAGAGKYCDILTLGKCSGYKQTAKNNFYFVHVHLGIKKEIFHAENKIYPPSQVTGRRFAVSCTTYDAAPLKTPRQG